MRRDWQQRGTPHAHLVVKGLYEMDLEKLITLEKHP